MIEDDTELALILTNYLHQYNIKIDNYETPELGISALNLKKYDFKQNPYFFNAYNSLAYPSIKKKFGLSKH